MKILVDIEEEININELVDLIKKIYPDKKINSITRQPQGDKKKFTGISDLKTLHKDNFKIYAREELYDR